MAGTTRRPLLVWIPIPGPVAYHVQSGFFTSAVISRGFEVPFVSQTGFGGTQVQFKDALLKLEVTPSVIDEPDGKRIKMRVLVEDNNPDFTRQVQGNPPIFKRMGQTEVIVREGEEHLSTMEGDEEDRLDMAEGLTIHSRLGCQAMVRGHVVVEIPK